MISVRGETYRNVFGILFGTVNFVVLRRARDCAESDGLIVLRKGRRAARNGFPAVFIKPDEKCGHDFVPTAVGFISVSKERQFETRNHRPVIDEVKLFRFRKVRAKIVDALQAFDLVPWTDTPNGRRDDRLFDEFRFAMA